MTQCDASAPFALALQALATDTPEAKLAAMDNLAIAFSQIKDSTAATPFEFFQTHSGVVQPMRGRCQRWILVSPDGVPRRRPTTASGRAALLHAVAHIEYSAIDLALDHALRFEGLPSAYYGDWIQVALDETRHFRMLRDHLMTLGHDYGDFPVHDGFWQMAERTALDALPRMAMVPRLLEARGLDATPPMQRKLEEAGDKVAVSILEVILRDEEGHVRLGDHWFRFLCRQRDLDPETTFRQMITEYDGPWPQQPMNEAARLAAGFSPEELRDLTACRPAR